MNTDHDGMERFGLSRDTKIRLLVAEPGFEPYERDDGLHPAKFLEIKGNQLNYNDWLRGLGYACEIVQSTRSCSISMMSEFSGNRPTRFFENTRSPSTTTSKMPPLP